MSQTHADHIISSASRATGITRGGCNLVRTILLCGVAAVAVSGCASQVPVATTWPMTTQKKMQSAHHWDVLAGHVEKDVAFWLRVSDLGGQTLSVAGSDDTAFGRGFGGLLSTHFLDDGFLLANPGQPALRIHHEAQVVSHKGRATVLKPGTFTLLGSGVAVARAAENGMSTGAVVGASIAGGLLADFASGYITSESNTEVIVTVSVSDANNTLLQRNYIFYINDDDSDQYDSEAGDSSLYIIINSSDPLARKAAWRSADQQCASRGRNKAMLRATAAIDDHQQGLRFSCVGL